MAGGFSALIDEIAQEVAQRGRPAAGASAGGSSGGGFIRKGAGADLKLMAKALDAEGDHRKRMMSDLQSIRIGPTTADHQAARERIQTTMQKADEDFAAGRITSAELGQLDWHARKLMEGVAA